MQSSAAKAARKRQTPDDHSEQVLFSCTLILTNPGTKQPLTLIAKLLGEQVKKLADKVKISKVHNPDTASKAAIEPEVATAGDVSLTTEVENGRGGL